MGGRKHACVAQGMAACLPSSNSKALCHRGILFVAIMFSPQTSSLFTPWVDPQSGVTSYLLGGRVAPMQMGFYFVNACMTRNARYLWFYCFYPPGGQGGYGGTLAVADLATNQIHHYPETQFLDASPFVDQETGEVYWTTGLEVWKRGPRPEDVAQLVNIFPAALAKGRRPWRLATHLTRSADGKSFAIDAQIGNEWFIGDLPLDQARPFELWQTLDDSCYNHAQFSPTDPDVILLAQDGWTDAATGKPGQTRDRLWLIRRGEKARAIMPQDPKSSDQRGHEWWDADGEHVWFIDYRLGTQRVKIYSGECQTVWKNGHTHSHSDRQGRYLVGDIAASPDDWHLAFYNILTDREINIVTQFPVYCEARAGRSWSLTATIPTYSRASYHVHPHPGFCAADQYICYTTNVRGTIDLALVPVAQLLAQTA